MADLELNRGVRAEIDLLTAQRLLTAEQALKLKERYPVDPIDLATLARWLSILGALSAGAGLVWLGTKLQARLLLLEGGLGGLAVALIFLGRWLGEKHQLAKTRAAIELLASFALQGLSMALAVQYSTGSDNWPALFGVDAALACALAYALDNRLVLLHASLNFLVFFGGETGHSVGWQPEWLGLNYPARYLAIGLLFLAAAYVHARDAVGRWQSFSRVYLHVGLLVVHLSLWFFAIFGWFEGRWEASAFVRLVCCAIWAAVCVACIFVSGKVALPLLRNYGLSFLLADAYTFYFEIIAMKTGELWWLHLLVVGASLVALAMNVDRLKGSQPET